VAKENNPRSLAGEPGADRSHAQRLATSDFRSEQAERKVRAQGWLSAVSRCSRWLEDAGNACHPERHRYEAELAALGVDRKSARRLLRMSLKKVLELEGYFE
jgi:hypothetical protein